MVRGTPAPEPTCHETPGAGRPRTGVKASHLRAPVGSSEAEADGRARDRASRVEARPTNVGPTSGPPRCSGTSARPSGGLRRKSSRTATLRAGGWRRQPACPCPAPLAFQRPSASTCHAAPRPSSSRLVHILTPLPRQRMLGSRLAAKSRAWRKRLPGSSAAREPLCLVAWARRKATCAILRHHYVRLLPVRPPRTARIQSKAPPACVGPGTSTQRRARAHRVEARSRNQLPSPTEGVPAARIHLRRPRSWPLPCTAGGSNRGSYPRCS